MEANFEKLRDAMLKVLENDKFSCFLGLEVVEFEEKFIKARIPFREEVINCYGSTHGGVLYSLADIIAGTVACMTGKFVSTVEGNMNYLEPAVSKEYIYVEAKRVRSGGHLVVVKVKLKNDSGKLLDDGSFTFYRSDKDVLEG